MKREFLKATIPDITEEQLKAILDENGRDIQAKLAIIAERDTTITTLTTERDGYKQQVIDRDKDIKKLQDDSKENESLSKQLTDLQNKYTAETQALNKKLTDMATDHATEAAFADVQFASTLARSAAIAQFKAKGYKLGEDGKYAEASAFIEQLKKDDPAAFKTEPEKEDKGQERDDPTPGMPPRFTGPITGGNVPPAGGKEAMTMAFNFVRKPPKQE